MKKLTQHFTFPALAVLLSLATFITSSCDPTKPTPPPPDQESSSSCPAIDKLTLHTNCDGVAANMTCTSTWQVPNGAVSFNVWFKRVPLGGQPELISQTSVTGGSFTASSLTAGQAYRIEIQSACAGGELSEIVIDDIVRK